MSEKRTWIIPATIIILVITAWAFRWGEGGYKDNKTYYVDRWLGQTWVKEVKPNSYSEYPLIAEEQLVSETQKAIIAMPDKKVELEGLSERIAEYNLVAQANVRLFDQFQRLSTQYGKEWLDTNRKDLIPWVRNQLAQSLYSEDQAARAYILSKIPQDIRDGHETYLDAQNMALTLDKQKTDIWNTFQNMSEGKLYDEAVKERKAATMGSMLIGAAALIWLIYLFVFDKPRSLKKEIT